MKIAFDGIDLKIESSGKILEINDSEEGLVICPESRTENLMEICMIKGSQKFYVKANIMWIQVVAEKKRRRRA